MARQTNDPELTLEEYAEKYIQLKREESRIKKEVEQVNKRMKTLMVEKDQTEAHCASGVVKYVVQHRTDFNEDKAIAILKATGNLDCIGTKEFVDMDILEKKLYNEALDKDVVSELDKCRVPKNVSVLTITKG